MKQQVYVIVWEDSSTTETMYWERLSDIKNEPSVISISVGMIVKESDDNIIVIPHISDIEIEDGVGCGMMTIPKSAILNRIKIEIEL